MQSCIASCRSAYCARPSPDGADTLADRDGIVKSRRQHHHCALHTVGGRGDISARRSLAPSAASSVRHVARPVQRMTMPSIDNRSPPGLKWPSFSARFAPVSRSMTTNSRTGDLAMARRAPFPSRLFLAAVVLSVLVLASLAQAGAQPKRGGVIRIAEREAPGLDPHLSISFLTHSYVSLAYSQLVRFPNGPEQKSPTDFSILPDLAEKWTVSKDGKVHNKPRVNGREVTADDVKYSLERFMAKSGFRDRFEPVTGIEVVDRHTVKITLKEPYAPFLNHLANPSYCAILPREAEEKFKDFNNPDAVIGTGPFVLKSYEKGVRVVFERNPNYFMKGLPYLDGATIDITPDAAARLAVLRAGKAELPHIWGWISPEEARTLKQTNPEMSITPYKVIGQGFIYLRTDQPPFNDVRVRRAVSLAIDRKSWNDAP